MQIIINMLSGVPIYEQISDQIEQQIVSGVLKSEEFLPSIRALANDLKVSVITTKKAYEVLEQKGWVVMVPQKGTMVSAVNTEAMKEKMKSEISGRFLELRAFAESHGFSSAEFRQLIEEANNAEIK